MIACSARCDKQHRRQKTNMSNINDEMSDRMIPKRETPSSIIYPNPIYNLVYLNLTNNYDVDGSSNQYRMS